MVTITYILDNYISFFKALHIVSLIIQMHVILVSNQCNTREILVKLFGKEDYHWAEYYDCLLLSKYKF